MPQLSDDTLRTLRRIGLLHAIDRARGKNGTRPKSAAEVVSLDLSLTNLSNRGLKELAPFQNLAALYLRGSNNWSAADFKGLAIFKNLVRSDIGARDESLRGLREVGLLHILRGVLARDGSRPKSAAETWSLDLQGMPVTGAGLKELASLENLAELDLSRTKVTDKDLKELASFKNLVTLDLRNTKITPQGLKALAPLQKLTTLYLPLTDTSVRVLREIGLLHALSRASGKDGLRRTRRPRSYR